MHAGADPSTNWPSDFPILSRSRPQQKVGMHLDWGNAGTHREIQLSLLDYHPIPSAQRGEGLLQQPCVCPVKSAAAAAAEAAAAKTTNRSTAGTEQDTHVRRGPHRAPATTRAPQARKAGPRTREAATGMSQTDSHQAVSPHVPFTANKGSRVATDRDKTKLRNKSDWEYGSAQILLGCMNWCREAIKQRLTSSKVYTYGGKSATSKHEHACNW